MIPDHVRLLAAAGHRAPSADNTQPWRFDWDGESLYVRYDAERVSGRSFPPDDPGTLLTIGCVSENIAQGAVHAGIRAEMHVCEKMRGTSQEPYLRIIPQATTLSADIRIEDHPLWRRHTNRFAFRREPLPAGLPGFLAELDESDAGVLLIDSDAAITETARLVASAAQIRFQTRELHEWLMHSLRFTPDDVALGDGLDIGTLDLPPGGRLFLRTISDWRRMALLNRLGAHKLLSALDSAPVARAPALIAILSGDRPEAVLQAGRLLARAWNRINEEGLAAHPYYVVADTLERLQRGVIPPELVDSARRLEAQATKALRLESGRRLRMLLRIGYPKRNPVRSRRLPLDSVLYEIEKD